MANLKTDKSRLSFLLDGNCQIPAADRLFRDQGVFFVGGALPVDQTMVTMFDSFCMEATTLFFLTFGTPETYSQGEEMARQIKKNFNVRLIANLAPTADAGTIERIYAAGVDNVLFFLEEDSVTALSGLPLSLQAARIVFPRWGAVATLLPGNSAPALTISRIDRLLQEGIVPLVQISGRSSDLSGKDIVTLLDHLAFAWEQNSVPLQAYLPLITAMTPLVATKPATLFRGIVDRLRDRHQLAGSDIRRHLRVQQTENSLDSAGL